MTVKDNKSNTGMPITLLIYAVFAVCVILTLLAGAGAYRRIAERDAETYNGRTAMQYVATKVRSAKRPEDVSLADVGGVRALRIEDDGYSTYVYCHDGWLKELYVEDGVKLRAEAGEKLIEAGSLTFELQDGLLKYSVITAGGNTRNGILSVRGEEVAA